MTDNVNSPAKWEQDYRRGTAGWDIGMPTPVFQRLIRSGEFPPGRMLVPGAGRGHDAREFARHGFDVVAVDFAQEAVNEMRALMDDTSRHEILQQDLFQLPPELNESFTYVLEYTCYCAIDPKRRDEYADTIARVLKRGGIYLALALPLDQRTGGPPFAVKADELIKQMQQRSLQVLHREFPADSIPPRKGNEELIVMQKMVE